MDHLDEFDDQPPKKIQSRIYSAEIILTDQANNFKHAVSAQCNYNSSVKLLFFKKLKK